MIQDTSAIQNVQAPRSKSSSSSSSSVNIPTLTQATTQKDTCRELDFLGRFRKKKEAHALLLGLPQDGSPGLRSAFNTRYNQQQDDHNKSLSLKTVR